MKTWLITAMIVIAYGMVSEMDYQDQVALEGLKISIPAERYMPPEESQEAPETPPEVLPGSPHV